MGAAAIAATAGGLLGLATAGEAPSTAALVPGFTATKAPVSPSGTRAVIDLPVSQHMHNTGGSDRAGLCVGTSVTHSARWQNVRELDGFRRWLEARPGGSFPEKLARDLKAFCAQKGVPVPRYVMGTGVDTRLMELAFRTRRCPAITHTAAHMVSGMHLDGQEGAILDNNNPGKWEWATRTRYTDVYSAAPRGRYGWVVVLLAPPPPPGADTVVPPAPTPAPAPAPVSPFTDPFVRPCPGPYCPQPRPCPGPYCPQPRDLAAPVWVPITYADGGRAHKLYDGGTFLGLLDSRGWHLATGPDSWLAEATGEPPVPPPADTGGVELGRIDLSRMPRSASS